MPIKVIGKSILGQDVGFSHDQNVIGNNFYSQLQKIQVTLPLSTLKAIIMTSMTDQNEIDALNGEYFPKIREILNWADPMVAILNPSSIYYSNLSETRELKPSCDFIIWNSSSIAVLTHAKEDPIIAFESEKGKALGTILKPSLIKHGDYLFSTIKRVLGDDLKVSLVTCDHSNGVPKLVENLAIKHNIKCNICIDSATDNDCYHKNDIGNHVVAMW